MAALPAYALGDQINVLIYWALGLLLAGFALVVFLVKKLLGGLFGKKPPPGRASPVKPPPTGPQPVTNPLWFLLLLGALVFLILGLLH